MWYLKDILVSSDYWKMCHFAIIIINGVIVKESINFVYLHYGNTWKCNVQRYYNCHD
jgi:hypothetical protein